MVHQPLKGVRSCESGFTLAELTIVIVIVSVGALLFSGMFVEAVRSYQFIDVEKGLLQESRYAEERITREIRRLRDGVSINVATASTLTFVDRDAAVISFSWNGTKGADLVYTRNGTARVLASNVDSLGFAYWKSDGASAVPLVAPSATDIWRVTIFLRLARGGQSVDALAAAFVRPA